MKRLNRRGIMEVLNAGNDVGRHGRYVVRRITDKAILEEFRTRKEALRFATENRNG